MGLFNGGGGSPKLQFSVNNYSGSSSVYPPKEIADAYTNSLNKVNEVAKTPWTNYSDNPWDFVAPTNGLQTAVGNEVGNNNWRATPYMTYGMDALNSAQDGYGASNSWAASAGQNVASNSVSGISDPYYQQGQNYTNLAATAPGGYQAASPYLNTAGNYINYGGQGTNQISQSDIQRYMTPYQQAAINPTLDLMKQSNEQAMQGALGNVIKGGGMGGDRAGVMMANLNQQNQMTTAKAMGDMQAANYNQAAQYAAGQRAQNQADLQRQLAAGQAYGQMGATAGQLQQADLGRVLQAGQQTANIGTAQRNAYEYQQQMQQADLQRKLGVGQLYNANAQGVANAGTSAMDAGLRYQAGQKDNLALQYQIASDMQKTQQAGKDALYNQYLQSKAYPFETTQFALDALSGLGPQYGSTTTETGSSSGLNWNLFNRGGRVKKRGGGSLSDHPEVVGQTFDGQDIYRYRYKEGGPAQIGLMADEVAPRYPNAVADLGGKLAVDYARATDAAAGLGHAMGAGREHFMYGGKENEKVRSFVPKLAIRPGQMMTSKPRGSGPLQFLSPGQKQDRFGGLKELAGNAQGLYQAYKGLSSMGGLGGMFNTAASTAAAPAAAVASAAPAAAAATTAASAAAPIKDAGSAVSNVADAGLGFFDPLEKLFAANGGSIPHFAFGGFSTRFDEEDDRKRGSQSFVPQSRGTQPSQMPVSHPNRDKIMGNTSGGGGGGGQQSGGGGLGQLADMATKGIGALKGASSLVSSAGGLGGLGSILGGAGAAGEAAGAAGAAAAGGGILEGLASFLPFLGLFSDPSMKTGVGNRKGFALGGPEDDEERRRPLVDLATIPVAATERQEPKVVLEQPKVDLGTPKTDAKPIMVASADNPNFADDALPVTLKREGGYTPNDAGAGASNKGINRRAHPNEDIEHMTNERAGQIYKRDYWDAIGADSLDPKIRLMAYDAAVNQGPGRAKTWAAQSGGDPQKLAELRMAHYQSLLDRNPETYGPYARSWAGRVNTDLSRAGLPLMALHRNGHATTGDTGGPDYTGHGGGSDPRSWMATAEDPNDRAVQTGLALLSGVAGGLAGAEHGGIAGAIGGGLSGFGGAYGKMADADLDRQKFDWQKQMDAERLGINKSQEGRAAEEYQRSKDRTEQIRREAGSAPGVPKKPSGGWAPEETGSPAPVAPAKKDLGSPVPVAPAPVAPVSPPMENPGLGKTPEAPVPVPENSNPNMKIEPGPEGPEVPVSTPNAGLGDKPVNPVEKIAQPVAGQPVPNASPIDEVRKLPAPAEDVRTIPNTSPNRPDPTKFWPSIVDDQNPYYLRRMSQYHFDEAERLRKFPELASEANQHYVLGEKFKTDSQHWASAPVLTNNRGETVLNPFVQQAKSEQSAIDTKLKANEAKETSKASKMGEFSPEVVELEAGKEKRLQDVKSKYDLVTVQPDPGGPKLVMTKEQALQSGLNGGTMVQEQPGYVDEKLKEQYKEDAQIPTQMTAREKSRERLERIGEILKTYKTGAFSEQKADFQKMLRSAGFDVKDTDMMNAAAFEQFTKNAVAQVFDDVKAMGGRILVSEIEGLTKANPNARMTPEANRQLIARAMGAIDWADKYDQDYVKWRNTGNNVYKDKSLFTIDWMKQSENKLKPFQEARVKEMKVLGSANEPEKQSAGVPGPLLDIQSNGNLQRKGDLYRDKSTGIVYDKDGKQVQQ
jgi:hypothetical protein